MASGEEAGSNRVNRGGSWNNNDNNYRSANRNRNNPDNRRNNMGFRLVSAFQGKDEMSHPLNQFVITAAKLNQRFS
ncbi:MAG: SUMF1/EgtB/PvdO family nonheme iron enzyme [Candidatus Riflebacteria bacterium]|nr:SUMF1/EgtB/PvdO family nonheme iron enzyme [Candidatus Riflebacteria bacterium]